MNTSITSDSVPPDADDWLADCLQKLAEHGAVTDPSDLLTYLPIINHDDRRIFLVELVKLDMALSAEAGAIRRLDHYFTIAPDLLSAGNVPIDLVLEELQLRREFGESPIATEYQQLYPQFATMLLPLEQSIAANQAVTTADAPPDLDIGEQLDDFTILQKLGQGAFAHVYLAQQISMRRLVALKVSRGKGGESQSLAQFDHPNIVRVFDQRMLTESSLHLLYMQFVPGGTLADVVKLVRSYRAKARDHAMGGWLMLQSIDEQLLDAAQVVPEQSGTRDWLSASPWPQVVAWIGVALCRALHEAHAHQILHRDVKPANVLLSAAGTPKLADFNVSFSDAAHQASQSASLGGSVAYMSPEHLVAIIDRGPHSQESIRTSADLYSLAVLLWELWQGQRPFQCETMPLPWQEIVADQLASRHRPLITPRYDEQETHAAAERVLERTLRRALSAEPSARFGDGVEMAGRLRLSLYPQAAILFDPPESSRRAWLSRQSPWVMACLVILIPHGIAGGLNYQYNLNEVMQTAELKDVLRWVSWIVNLTYFPFATLCAVWQTRSMVRAVENARQDQRVDSRDLGSMLELGHRAAIIGGVLWLSSGILFPLVFHYLNPDFQWIAALQLFLSSLVCGGIAMAYPYFGMAWLATFVFYPLCLRNTMQDADFEARADRMAHRGEAYILIAAIVPLIGGALMMSSPTSSRWFMLAAVIAGMLGIVVASYVHRRVVIAWSQMGQVLLTNGSTIPE